MSSAFKVDSSSLKELRSVWKGLTSDVAAFNAEVKKLKEGVATIADLQAALGNIGGGRGNPAAGSTARVAGMRGRTTTVSASISGSRVASPSGTGGISGSPITPPPGAGSISQSNIAPLPSQDPSRGSRAIVGGAVAAVGAAGSYTAQHFTSTVSMDYMANQMARGMNGGYSSGNKNSAWLSMSNMGGYQNSADLQAGMAQINQQGFSYGTARGSAIMGGVAGLAKLNPGAGLSGAAAGYAGMTSVRSNYALQSMGAVAAIGAGGVRQDPKVVARSVLTRLFRGRMPTPQELQEGMQPGAPLYQSLQQFPPETQQAIISVGMDDANKGGGRNDSILASQNMLGRARGRVESALGIRSSGMMQTGLGFMSGVNDVGGSVAGAPIVGTGIAGAGTASMLGAGAGKSLLSVGGGMLGWRMGEGLFNKAAGSLDKVAGRGGAGKLAGAAGRLSGGLGGVAGMEVAKAMGATPVFVMNWPAGFGGGGIGGGLKGAEKVTEEVKAGEQDLSKVAKAGRLARLGGVLGMTATPGGGAALMGGLAGAAVIGAPIAAIGALGLKMQTQAYANRNAQSALNLQSADQLTVMLNRVQAWGLQANPQFVAEYDRTIKPMIISAGQLSGQARASAQDRAAAALGRLTMKYQQSGSAHLTGLVNAQTARNAAAGAVSNPADPWHHGTQQISQGGGASGSGGKGGGAPSSGGMSSSSSAAVKVAEQYLGMTYVYGGSNPKSHFDCSGLTQWSYGQLGVKLPRTAAAQQHAFPQVPANQARAGDLVTFGSPNAHHVALYMGNGQMIAAPHTGDKIKIQPVYQDQTEYHRVMGGGAIPSGLAAPGALGGGGTPTAAGSNGAPPSLGGPAAASQGGGMFVEANPSTEEVDALSSALSGGIRGGGFHGLSGQGGGTGVAATGGSVSTGPVAPTPNAPNNPSGNVALGKQLAAAYGWNSGPEWNALYATFQEESGWSNTEQNKTSTAYGIGQFLNSTWADTGYRKTSDPATQINAALKYIKGRYGDPIKEWAFHQKHNYYEKGAWRIAKDELAHLHKDEMVVPKKTADKMRAAIASPGSSGGGGGVAVTIHAPITLAGKATQADANDYVRMIEGRMKQSKVLQDIGEH